MCSMEKRRTSEQLKNPGKGYFFKVDFSGLFYLSECLKKEIEILFSRMSKVVIENLSFHKT